MTDDLDQLLSAAAPDLVEPAGTKEALVDLVLGARRQAALTARRRRRRVTMAGAASGTMLLVGGAAAASALGWTAPWAAHPLTSISYTLPSGGTCEERIGDLQIANPIAQQDIQQWLSQHPLSQIADVDAALREGRASPNWWGSVRVGYGTAHDDPDYEYDTAVWQAIATAIDHKLKADGFTQYVDITWGAETHCTGTNPFPEVPSWMK